MAISTRRALTEHEMCASDTTTSPARKARTKRPLWHKTAEDVSFMGFAPPISTVHPDFLIS